MRVGVDTGGTFTDVVADDGRIAKVPSTPARPGEAVRTGAATVTGGRPPTTLAHGTTVATNALLERRGARVALVTTAGFADVVEIARQDRPSLYDPWADRPAPLVDRELRLEVAGRSGPDGSELEPVTPADVPVVPGGVDAVAGVPAPQRSRPVARARGGHRAGVAGPRRVGVGRRVPAVPRVRAHGHDRRERLPTPGVSPLPRRPGRRRRRRARDDVGRRPRPRGGRRRAARVAAPLRAGRRGAGRGPRRRGKRLRRRRHVRHGRHQHRRLPRAGRRAGAGGGAVGRRLPHPPAVARRAHDRRRRGVRRRPRRRRGRSPSGPAAQGPCPVRPATAPAAPEPTVTDADLVAGRLLASAALPGIGPLDRRAAEAALDRAGVTAADVLAVVDAAMEEAVRAVSVARGVDPAGLALVAFGGAGPLHACAIADALAMAAVVVPARAGVLSAVGCLGAPRQHDLVHTWPGGADLRGLDAALDAIAAEALAAVPGGDVATAVECRYEGQSHELRVAAVADFPAEHERRNGYARPGTPIEVVAIRATARRSAPVGPADLPAPERDAVVGPAVVAEPDCTIWVPAGWRGEVHPTSGALVLTRVGGG